MRIVSVPGRLVRDPNTRRVVDADGITVDPANLHWARLLADRDVVAAPADPDEPVPAPDAPAPAAADQEA